MLNVAVQNSGDVVKLRCQGRIVLGPGISTLRAAVLSRIDSRAIVLDLAQVECIDAGGLGVLLELRAWAQSCGIQLRLRNLQNRVQQVFELTKLDSVFGICAVRNTFPQLPRLLQVAWSDRSP